MERELRCGLGVRERMLRLWTRRGIMNKVSSKSDIKDSKNKVTIEVYDSVEVVDINKGKSARELKMRKIITDITSVIIKVPEKSK